MFKGKDFSFSSMGFPMLAKNASCVFERKEEGYSRVLINHGCDIRHACLDLKSFGAIPELIPKLIPKRDGARGVFRSAGRAPEAYLRRSGAIVLPTLQAGFPSGPER